jgi:hypothetical protein
MAVLTVSMVLDWIASGLTQTSRSES